MFKCTYCCKLDVNYLYFQQLEINLNKLFAVMSNYIRNKINLSRIFAFQYIIVDSYKYKALNDNVKVGLISPKTSHSD